MMMPGVNGSVSDFNTAVRGLIWAPLPVSEEVVWRIGRRLDVLTQF